MLRSLGFSPLFQSAPLTEARGDHWQLQRPEETQCFNPLPLPKQGETCQLFVKVLLHHCFNPLPLPKQGETST